MSFNKILKNGPVTIEHLEHLKDLPEIHLKEKMSTYEEATRIEYLYFSGSLE